MRRDRFPWMLRGLVWSAGTALVLTAALVLLLAALAVADEPEEGRPLPDSAPPMQVAASSAPGYCPTSGGRTDYERLNSVSVTAGPGGTVRLTVKIYIANPQGCNLDMYFPCPAHSLGHEIVQVWIDWDGDKTWDWSEKVMDVAGGHALHFRGTQTFFRQFKTPVITGPTWLRARLRYTGLLPTFNFDPCLSSWTFGNVVDMLVHPQPPEIESIHVTPTKGAHSNPETTREVSLEAKIKPAAGYEVVVVTWFGDIPSGQGNPYKYVPDPGSHGLKVVRATLTSRHTATGVFAQTIKMHQFKLFFIKEGDEDGDRIPNWFEHWKADGAVPELKDPIVEYDTTLGGYTVGQYDPSIDKIQLGGGAAGKDGPVTLGPTTFPEGKGIDLAAITIAHESKHKWISDNWKAGGIWATGTFTDSDQGVPTAAYDDDLPDSYETGTVGTLITTTDSFSLGARPGWGDYKYYGDNEYAARLAELGVTGVAAKDWANPGKQSDPTYDSMALSGAAEAPPRRAASGPAGPAAPYHAAAVLIPGLASLTGSYSEQGVDTNGDGSYESLRVSVGVLVTATAQYNVVGWLKDGSGNQIAWARNQGILSPGTQTVNLDFDGQVIYKHGAAGPYSVSRVELRIGREERLVDAADNVRTTAAYSLSSFARPAVVFTGSYSDSGVDSDGDGLYNTLRVTVGLDVAATGTYTILGWLRYASDGSIAGASTSGSLSAGSQQVNLDFDGRLVRQSRKNGPYRLRGLNVQDAAGTLVNFVGQPYTTTAYGYNQFQWHGATLNPASYTDAIIDLVGDGIYDYLRLSLSITATHANTYTLAADLVASDGGIIATSQVSTLTVASGSNQTHVEFPGPAIYRHGVNGPYTVTRVSLLDASGILADQQNLAHTTQPYTYTIFRKPAVYLTGNYQDYGQDTDGDGKHDELVVLIGVSTSLTGTVGASAHLVDSAGQEIEWATNSASLPARTGLTLTLPFNGSTINATGRSGPYLLRDLYVYHDLDPHHGVSVTQAHTTAAYNYWDFQGGMRVYLPALFRQRSGGW